MTPPTDLEHRTANPPLVSCICITKNRRAWLPTAIDNFLKQTYRPIELVVVNDDDADGIGDLLIRRLSECGPGQRISFFALPESQRRTVGQKRNRANELSAGELIATWDDDDWSSPDRVAAQVKSLLSVPTAVVTGFRNMVFTDGAKYWIYEGTPGFMIGTSLLYRRAWWLDRQFEDRNVCEDSQFCMTTGGHQRVSVGGESVTTDLMYATIHGGNTSPRTVVPYSWKEIERPAWIEKIHDGFGIGVSV